MLHNNNPNRPRMIPGQPQAAINPGGGPPVLQPPPASVGFRNPHEAMNGYQQQQFNPQSYHQPTPNGPSDGAVYNAYPAPPAAFPTSSQPLQQKDQRIAQAKYQPSSSHGNTSSQGLNGGSVPPVNSYNNSSYNNNAGVNYGPQPPVAQLSSPPSVPSSNQVVYPPAPHAPYTNGYPAPTHPSSHPPILTSGVTSRQPVAFSERSQPPFNNSSMNQYNNPQSHDVNQMNSRLNSMSLNKSWEQMWGKESVNLMSEKNIKCRPGPPEEEDDANCDRDVMRSTLQKVPESSSLLQKSRLPFGILLHPFRDDEVCTILSLLPSVTKH